MKIRFHIAQQVAIVLTVFGILFCCQAKELSLEPKNASKGTIRRALLIGIDSYQNVRQLHGCVNDVVAMRQLLISRFSFGPEMITLLKNEQAKRKAILTAFRDLVEVTGENDIVFIHFSGHGSQIPSSTKKEVDSLDETIIPYDYNYTSDGQLPISDKQISAFLGELVKKTHNVTIVLDCCHSGGGTKDLSVFDERGIGNDSRKIPANDDFMSGGSRVLNDPDASYVLLAACRADQKSYELNSATGGPQGIFTHFLINELKSADSTDTWAHLIEDTKTQIWKYHYDQSPQIEGGNKNSFVFGGRYNAKPYLLVQPKGDSVIIEGGMNFGLTRGSILNIYPPKAIKFSSNEVIATATISKVSLTSSRGKILSGKISSANCRATEKFHEPGSEQLKINFDGFEGPLLAIKKEILALGGIAEEQRVPMLSLKRQDKFIKVYIGRDTNGAVSSFPVEHTQLSTLLANNIRMWRRWFQIANIRNPNSKLSLSLTITTRDNTKGFELSHADYTFKHGDKLKMEVKNNSQVPLFITIVDMEDNGKITTYPLTQFVDPTKNSNEKLPANSSITVELDANVTGPNSESRDVLRAFATLRDISFSFLDQGNEETATKELKPKDPGFKIEDDWCVWDRIILVKK